MTGHGCDVTYNKTKVWDVQSRCHMCDVINYQLSLGTQKVVVMAVMSCLTSHI